jgi:hypothetical protein
MRLLVFCLILTSCASIWAGYGWLELVAFSNGAIVTLMAAAIVSSLDEEEE